MFADTIRKHTLEATGGATYAEMPRTVFEDSGKPVPEDQVDQALASGKAIDNPEREIWITSTALSTALNTSYFAESVATFTIVVGAALILIGIGLFVLARNAVSSRAYITGGEPDSTWMFRPGVASRGLRVGLVKEPRKTIVANSDHEFALAA